MPNCLPHLARRLVTFLCVLCVASGLISSASAQLPNARLFAIFPPGGQQGKTVDVTLASGADLDGLASLIFSHPGITAARQGDSSDSKTFAVSVAADVPPGQYEVRAQGRFGISNPRFFTVSAGGETLEAEPNNAIEQTQDLEQNVVVSGRCDAAGDIDFFAVQATAGQRLLIECWSERLESRMDATLVLLSAEGTQLAASRDSTRRDPMIDYNVPADGRYIVKVHDFLYRGGPEYVYRLRAGTTPHIDFVYPPAGPRGSQQTLTVFGRNLPDSIPDAALGSNAASLEKSIVAVQLPEELTADVLAGRPPVPLADTGLEAIRFSIDSPVGPSNSVPVGLATAPLVAEHEPNDRASQAQQVILPCELVGQFSARGDRDWIRFDARKGDVFWIEVWSEQYGLAGDPYVLIQRVIPGKEGAQSVQDVAELDDRTFPTGPLNLGGATRDPLHRFEAPESGTYLVMIRDLYADARGGPDLVYRLAIRRPQPDFRLMAVARRAKTEAGSVQPAAPLVRRGGTVGIELIALRRDGFDGPIHVSVSGLPEGLKCPPAVIGAGVHSTVLVVEAPEEAAAWHGPIQITGKAQIGDREVVRQADAASVSWEVPNTQPSPVRLSHQLMLAVCDQERAPCVVALAEEKTWETAPGGNLKIPLKLARRDGCNGPVKITAFGAPAGVKIKELTVAADKAEGVLEVAIDKGSRQGGFTFPVVAYTQIDYRRNLAAVLAAQAAQAEADKQAAAATALAEKSQTEKQAGEEKLAQSQQQHDAAAQALAAAEQQSRDKSADEQAAQTLLALATTAVAEHPGDATFEAAKTFADKAVAAAAAAKQAASDAQATAQTTLDAAKQTLAEAQQGRDALAQVADEAAAKAKTAQEAKQAADENAKKVDEANKPQKTDVALYSSAIQLAIKPPAN